MSEKYSKAEKPESLHVEIEVKEISRHASAYLGICAVNTLELRTEEGTLVNATSRNSRRASHSSTLGISVPFPKKIALLSFHCYGTLIQCQPRMRMPRFHPIWKLWFC